MIYRSLTKRSNAIETNGHHAPALIRSSARGETERDMRATVNHR